MRHKFGAKAVAKKPGNNAEESKYERLKIAVEALLRESPLLQGCPHEGSVTGELVKKVLEAMK